jgi:hypothetical protein
MSNVTSSTELHIAPDESMQRTVERRERVANKIAERALSEFHENRLSCVVRGGRLGLKNTTHQTDVYDLVAQRLLGEGVEVTVHSITQTISRTYGIIGATYTGITAHIISAATVEGWPKHNPLHPIGNPCALVGGNEVHKVEQVYPPQPPEISTP